MVTITTYRTDSHWSSVLWKYCPLHLITIYRAPSGNFATFLIKLDNILKYLYTPTLDFIIVGDINVNYLVDSTRKSQLEALLKTYNITSIVNFPTRIQKKNQPRPLITSSLMLVNSGIIPYPQSSMVYQTMMLSPSLCSLSACLELGKNVFWQEW